MTRSGKTTLAVKLAELYRGMRKPVAVLTPAGLAGQTDPRWKGRAHFITSDREKFLAVLRSEKSWGAMAFVDEANQTIGWNDIDMEKLFTAGSMHGLTMHAIAQRAASFNKTVREQCSRLYLFRQGPDDALEMARQFGHPELKNAPKLGKGQYFTCTTEQGSLRGPYQLKLGAP
jgi:hypothetical protein